MARIFLLVFFLAGAKAQTPEGAPPLPTTAANPTGSAEAGAGVAQESPAEMPAEEESIWDYVETQDGAPTTPALKAAAIELAAERAAELTFQGEPGAAAPIDFYLDPLKATDDDPLHLEMVNPKEFDIPVVVNNRVISWMNYFLGPGRKYYVRYLQRSTRWMPMMHRELRSRNMPLDLVYLSMIESGFSYGATSYASAVGLWQFMPGTARDYGLRIDSWVDERRDPEKSTDSALRYLRDLAKMFNGDWWLAWASYNGGQGRVMSATRKMGTTDFWKIAEGDVLHPETENYVPKLLAAAIIGKHPERYGFVGIKYEAEFTFDRVSVPGGTAVDVLASCAGVSVETFLDYNPALKRQALSPEPATQSIRVPKGAKAKFEEAFAKVPPPQRVAYQRHVVRKGESLASIAKKYGVSTAELAQMNRIPTSTRVKVGMELLVPVRPGSQATPSMAVAANPPELKPPPGEGTPKGEPKSEPKPKTETVYHTVKKGETLSGIAQKYGVSVSDLQKWNGLKSAASIQAGMKLKVVAPAKGAESASSSSSSGSSSSASKPSTTYVVKKGDTLGSIASAHGVSIDQLKSWNNLSSNTIQAGQKLVVQGGKASASSASSTAAKGGEFITYTVKKGDTLSSIADRYNCTQAEIKSWNNLKSSTIYAGQKLKIKKD